MTILTSLIFNNLVQLGLELPELDIVAGFDSEDGATEDKQLTHAMSTPAQAQLHVQHEELGGADVIQAVLALAGQCDSQECMLGSPADIFAQKLTVLMRAADAARIVMPGCDRASLYSVTGRTDWP